MGITSFQPVCNLAKDFIARAHERDLAANLVPALTASGQIAVGVVVENSTQAFEMGQIFGNDFGPISVDSWGVVQILTFPATTIRRIE
ncbi:hypothetical protein [Stutzerimonas stutzeri]|uniref:hypothetical protein n=1 Tax=Stutzerimonas stutzeri TaxID=316 RepID=UPI001BCBCFA8|nr:hypothetical protein [Stutzerimonas stutzeri]